MMRAKGMPWALLGLVTLLGLSGCGQRADQDGAAEPGQATAAATQTATTAAKETTGAAKEKASEPAGASGPAPQPAPNAADSKPSSPGAASVAAAPQGKPADPGKAIENASPAAALPNPLRDAADAPRAEKGRGPEMAPLSPPMTSQAVTPPAVSSSPPPAAPAGTVGRETQTPLTVKVQTKPPAGQGLPGSVAAASLDATGPSGGAGAEGKTGAKASGGKGEAGDFDPVKENGPIFVGWDKPKLALLISGRQDGYLEPCGCAGLEKMKGGLTRRHTLFRQLRQQGWPVVGLDAGGLIKGFGRQAQMKLHYTVEAMKTMGYDAIGLGGSDLQLPTDELLADVAGTPQQPSPFVAANVGLFGMDSGIPVTKRVIEAGGLKVGVTAVLGLAAQKQINNRDVAMTDPEAALAKIVPDLKKESNLLVLLAYAPLDESAALAKRFPEFDVVVTTGGPPEPPDRKERVGKTLFVQVGEKGSNAVVLGYFEDPDPEKAVRYQRVPLDSRFVASPDMKKIMRDYQTHVKLLGFEGLGVKPVPNPKLASNGTFVGTQKCKACHEKSFDIWKKTGHGKAFRTLVELDPPRQFDPECISCHVVGWHPTQYFPYQGGYESLEKTPHLIDVGCEACHGPGELHVKAEMGSDAALQAKYQKAMVVTKADSEKFFCVSCHDGDNSPAFNFKTYWPKVEHYEKE